MATNSVEYLSCTRICCGDLPAPIVLCLPAEIVAPHLCPSTYGYSGTSGGGSDSGGGGGSQPFDYTYIEAEISSETEVKGVCNTVSWRYIFTYDTSQLIEGAVLVGTSITGVICKGCFTEWVEQLIGNEPYIETNPSTGEQVFISPHGCEYPIVQGSYCLDVADTDSVNLTLTPDSPCDTLSADVNISEDGGNVLEAREDGLYVSASGGAGSYIPLCVNADLPWINRITSVTSAILDSCTIPANTFTTDFTRVVFKAYGLLQEVTPASGSALAITINVDGSPIFRVDFSMDSGDTYWELNGSLCSGPNVEGTPALSTSVAIHFGTPGVINSVVTWLTEVDNVTPDETLPIDLDVVGEISNLGGGTITLDIQGFHVDMILPP